jgi:chromosome segregation ATPase
MMLVLPQVQHLGELQSPVHQLDPHLQLQLEAEREALQRRMAEAEAQTVAAMQAQRAAEARVAELQGEVAHLHSSYQAQAASRGAGQLEQQLRELQELLYQKQQQMERLSGEKQAQQLMLERQVGSIKKACTLCCD